MKTTGVIRRVDNLGRIVIPKDIRKTLRIRDGESLEFFVDNEVISLKKFSTSASLSVIAQPLLDTICLIIKRTILVSDRDMVVSCAGTLKKEFIGENISSKLEKLLFQNENLIKGICLEEELVDKKNMGNSVRYIFSPILADGEVLGSVLMLCDEDKSFNKEDEDIVLIIANFLSKSLEE